MATITLGGFTSSTKTIDQNSYPGDQKLTVDSVAGNTTLTINNVTNSDDVLDLTQTRLIPIGGTSTLNLGENAHVKISEFFDVSAGQTSNYNLGEGSTLEYSPPSIGGGAGNSTTFDLGSGGTSTLIYNPGGLQLDLSSSPKIAGLSAGDQIQVNGATQGAVEGGNLVFRDDNGRVVGSFNAEGQDLSKVTFEGGTMVYACYLKGTHIATPEGEVQVESLKAG
ncbi:Hint domain-containing protein, partial [Advenella kashmirensis]